LAVGIEGLEATLTVETLRGWMLQAGLWQAKRRRAKRIHSPRARRECLGELVQIDASHHDWFEGRSTKCCLIAFIDDATGRVLGAKYFEQVVSVNYPGRLDSARINGHDAYAYSKDLLERLPIHPASRIDELPPHRWEPPYSE
jgi:hypothetical protein